MRSRPISLAVAFVLSVAFLVTVSTGASDPAQAVTTLRGEKGQAYDSFTKNSGSYCNPDGSGVIDYTATVPVSGPLAGTLTMNGLVTIGPDASSTNVVTGFTGDFTIVGSETVTGMMTLAPARGGPVYNKPQCFGPTWDSSFQATVRFEAKDASGALFEQGFMNLGGWNRRLTGLQSTAFVDFWVAPEVSVRPSYLGVDEAGIANLGEIEPPVAVGGGVVGIYVSPAPIDDIGVQVTTVDGTATAGADYVAVSQIITVAGIPGPVASSVSEFFTVPYLDDALAEGLEDFDIAASIASGAAYLPQPLVAMEITDDDSTTLTFDDVAVLEGGIGTWADVFVSGSLNAAAPNSVFACLVPAGGTATPSGGSPDVDFFLSYIDSEYTCSATSPLTLPITMYPGAVALNNPILMLVGDDNVEYDETVEFIVEWVWGAQLIGDGTFTFTIIDDDNPDLDGDGVDDRIGPGDGTFSDVGLGGTTVGAIVANPGNLPILVDDVQPGGVRITTGSGTGTVTVSICSPAFTLTLMAGSDVTLTCGSITADVVTGPVLIEVPGGTSSVSVPTGVEAKITPTSGGAFTVEHISGTDTVLVTVGGVTSPVEPGSPPTEFTLNEPPAFVSVDAPVDPVNQPLTVSATFTDPDVGDSQSCEFAWGDETSTTISASGLSCVGTHTYTSPGVYPVGVKVTDAAGETDNIATTVVVYDPDGEYVIGGGRIDSPAGAYRPDPAVEGRAYFWFASKYQNGATIPGGVAALRFSAAGLNFRSTDYDWMVVTEGEYAMVQGTGTINGAGSYPFTIWAGDGTGLGGSDTFRIKISDQGGSSGGSVIYDNGPDPSISRGFIVVLRPRVWSW